MPEDQILIELIKARSEGRALAAVNIYDMMGAQAVAAAAFAEQRCALIQTASSSFALTGVAAMAALAVAVRDSSAATVGVHLDHCRDIDQVKVCLDAGYDSIMFDGSHLPLAENIELTAAAAAVTHSYGAWIEGELGATAGEEDHSTDVDAGALTDPQELQTFVDASGVDIVAVAVGNVHGIPPRPVHLDLDRLAELNEAVDIPIVLHGASGLSDAQIRAAIGLGVAKINVNTEVRRAYLDALRTSLSESTGDGLADHLSAARQAATVVIRHKIRLFDGPYLQEDQNNEHPSSTL
jgi:fructose-bisphosphate aldolase class II/tagatose 1,6-diphosphate aldolase GatY/KbaY